MVRASEVLFRGGLDAAMAPGVVMAVLLRNTRTGFFYAGFNRWRFHPEDAFDFQTSERARRWISTILIPDVEIVQMHGFNRRPENDIEAVR
jgi:hypothetical protein